LTAGIRTKGMEAIAKGDKSFAPTYSGTVEGSSGNNKTVENEGTAPVEGSDSGFTAKTNSGNPLYNGSTSTSMKNGSGSFDAKGVQNAGDVTAEVTGNSQLSMYAYNSMKLQEQMLNELKIMNGGNKSSTRTETVNNPDSSSQTQSSSNTNNKTVGVSKITVNAPQQQAQQKKSNNVTPDRNTDYNFSQKSIMESAS
jgi:hypothetical protein